METGVFVLLAEREPSIDDIEVHVDTCPYLRGTTADDLARSRDLGVDPVILFGIAGGQDDLRHTRDDLAARLVSPAKGL